MKTHKDNIDQLLNIRTGICPALSTGCLLKAAKLPCGSDTAMLYLNCNNQNPTKENQEESGDFCVAGMETEMCVTSAGPYQPPMTWK